MEQYVIVEKGVSTDTPIVAYPSFSKCAKWLVDCGHLFGFALEIYYVKTYKRKPNQVEIEAEYEVLP